MIKFFGFDPLSTPHARKLFTQIARKLYKLDIQESDPQKKDIRGSGYAHTSGHTCINYPA